MFTKLKNDCCELHCSDILIQHNGDTVEMYRYLTGYIRKSDKVIKLGKTVLHTLTKEEYGAIVEEIKSNWEEVVL